MDLKIALSGDLPARCSDALAALAPELGMVPAAEGVPVRGHRGAALAVCCDGASVTIEWAQPIQFYRALSLLPRPLAACDIREEPCFETVGMMFDTSRNAVLRPDTLRSFLRKMALMGMNLGMMYTEDTYEVPGVELVYWDYYHMREAEYDEQLKKHDALHAPTVFAGGIWTWCGPAPDYDKTRTATLAGLSACRKAGVPLVFATAWGDNGAEANLYTALLGMQMFAEFTYHGSFEDEWLAQRMRVCCQADARAFWDLTLFNHMEGMRSGEFRPVNAAKMLLYQDPLVQLFTKDTQGFALSRHYAALAPRYEAYTAEGGAFAPLWQFYAMLADVLAKKCVWHEQASQAVVSHDTALAKQLADGLTETIGAVEALRLAWLSLWNATNKPHGFEVIDGRLGGVAARLDTAQRRMRAFAAGECDTIPELAEPALPYTLLPDGTLDGSYRVGEILSACKIDG